MDPETAVFIGVGGEKPGVLMLNPEGDAPIRVLTNSPGDTPYALATLPGEKILAVGTKRGDFYLVDLEAIDTAANPDLFPWGVSFLSLSTMGNARLAFSDVQGRCGIFDVASRTCHPRIFWEGAPICSLVSTDSCLVGLTVSGEVLVWNRSDLSLARTLCTGVPPQPWGLVRGVYLPSWGKVLFPSVGGHVQILDPESGEAVEWQAHQGDFHALIPTQEGIITIGTEDAQIKVWSDPTGRHAQSVSAPRGVVAGAAVPSSGTTLLLLDKAGNAHLFNLDNETPIPDRPTSDSPCRSLVGPSFATLERMRRRLREREVAALAAEATGNLDANRLKEFDSILERIESLEFPQVALGLRALQANKQEEPLAELALRHSLFESYPEVQASLSSVQEYLNLLLRLGQFETAERLSQEADRWRPDSLDLSEKWASIRMWAEFARTEEPLTCFAFDPKLSDLIDAAEILQTGFHLCCRIKELPDAPCQGRPVDSDELLEVWNHSQAKDPRSNGTHVRVISFRLVRYPEIGTPEEALVFSQSGVNPAINLAVLFIQTTVRTVLRPIVFFNPGRLDSNKSPSEHNRLCHEALLSAKTTKVQTWLALLWHQVRQTTSVLLNKPANRSPKEAVLS